jgi:RHS repeat-associated protein
MVSGISTTLGTSGSTQVQNNHYVFNSVGCLRSRSDGSGTETFLYDDLNRLTSEQNGNASIGVHYEASGNIASKGNVGIYNYVQGTHQLASIALTGSDRGVGTWSYTYDLCGNMVTGADRTYSWNSENKPVVIHGGGASGSFVYGPSGQVLIDALAGASTNQVTTHIGGGYEVVEQGGMIGGNPPFITNPAETFQRCYIGGVAVVINKVNAGVSSRVATQYFHTDHLGSLEAITDDAQTVVERFAYDAWGARTNTATSGSASQVPAVQTGFTGHQQLDDLGLIHMIGRVYDPIVGRFVSADPTVQAPGNGQSFNRYTYCMNNPLSLTDPTGYNWFGDIFKDIGNAFSSAAKAIAKAVSSAAKWVKQNWKTLVVVAVAIVVSYVTLGALTGPTIAMGTAWATVAAGAAGGAVSGGLSTALNGGSASQIFLSALKGAVIGAATAGLTYGVAHGFEGFSSFGGKGAGGLFGDGPTGWLETKAVEAGIGGGGSAAGGGGFKSGALGVVAGALMGAGGMLDAQSTMVNAILAGVAGGTVSKLCGGSFANGAVTAAFAYLFNDAAEEMRGSGGRPNLGLISGALITSNPDVGQSEVSHMVAGDTSDFAAGAADMLTFDITSKVRGAINNAFDLPDTVDRSSFAYNSGEIAGGAAMVGDGVLGLARGGAELSGGLLRGTSAGKWLNSGQVWRVGIDASKGPTLRLGTGRFAPHINLSVFGY